MADGHSSNANAFAILAALAVCVLGAFVLWFRDTFGLDFASSAAVLMRLGLWSITLAAFWKFGDDFGLLEMTWPAFIGLFFVCWWPAMDYWAAAEFPAFFRDEQPSVWWNEWYMRWGGLVGLTALGYGGRQLLVDRY